MEWTSRLLTAEQFERIRGDPRALLARADARIEELAKEKERLLAQSVVDKLNTEQAVNTLEQHYIAVKRELEAVHEHYQKLRTENETRLTSFDQLNAENQRLKQRIVDLEAAQYQGAEIHAEKRQLLAIVERKETEVKRQSRELAELAEKQAKFGTEKLELQRRVNELETNCMQAQFEATRLSREKQHLEQQFQWASNELDLKATEVAESRKEKATQVMALRMQLDDALESRRLAEEQLSMLRTRSSEVEKQKNTATEKLKEVRDELTLQAEQFRRELAAKDSLNELLKSNADEYQAKLKDAQQIVDGTKALLQQEKDRAQAVVAQAEERVNKTAQENADLTKELEVLTARLAAAPVAVPISPTTRPLELQMRYEETSRALQAEKSENRRLSNYLNQILKEIEDKAPLIQEQRVEYEKTLRRNERLASNLETAMSEIDALRTERATITEEKRALQRESEDLSRQVQLLLREVQQARERGGERFGEELRAAEPPPLVDIQGELVPEHLIAFTSIQSLQQNNVELLRLVHKLQDERRREAGPERLAELTAAKEELAKLKEQRNQAEVLMQGIVRQRDMYRALAQARDQEAVSLQPMLQAEPPTDSNRVLRELQEDYDRYRREQGEVQRTLNEQLLEKTNENSDLRVQLAKAQTQLELNHDRYTLLQGNLESHRKENDALRAKNAEYSNSVIEHQRRAEEFRQEVQLSKDKQRQLEVAVSNLRVEKEVLQASEKRALAERTSVAAERDRMQGLLDNLQNLLLSKESSEADLRRKLLADVASAKEENGTIRQQLDELRAERERERSEAESRQRQLTLLVEAKEKLAADVREQLIKSSADYEALSAQLRDARAQLAKAEASLEMLMRTTISGDKNKDAESAEKRAAFELSQARVELVNLKESLTMEQQNLAHYKEIAATYEAQLKETSKTFDEFRAHCEAQTASLTAERDRANKRVAELETLVQQYQAEQESLEKKLREQISATEAAKRQTEAVEKELKASQERVEEVQRNVGVRSDLLQEAQMNYERELLAHAKDVEALNTHSREKEQLRAALEEAKQKLANEMAAHQGAVNSAAEVRASLERQLQVQEQRLLDLDKQNSMLHQQVERVNAELRKAQAAVSAGIIAPVEANAQQLEEMRDLLHLVRREKDIAVAAGESSRQEALRLKQQLDHALRNVDEARALARAAEERLNKESETAAQHQAAVAQLQQLNLLRESNVTLRDENERAARKVRELQDKLTEMEARVAPLQEERAQLAALRDVLQTEKAALETENGRWRVRVQQLIDRGQRIDPADHEALKEQCKAQTEKAIALAASLAALEAQANATKEELAKLTEEKNKLAAEATSHKEQMSRAMGVIRQGKEKQATAAKEKEEAVAEVKKITEELEKTKTEITEVRALSEETQRKIKSLEEEQQKLKAAAEAGKAKEEKLTKLASEATKKVREVTATNNHLLVENKTLKETVAAQATQLSLASSAAPSEEIAEGTATPTPAAAATEAVAAPAAPVSTPAPTTPAPMAVGGKRKQPEVVAEPSAEETTAAPSAAETSTLAPPPAAAFAAPPVPSGVAALAKRAATALAPPSGLTFGLPVPAANVAPPSPQQPAPVEEASQPESMESATTPHQLVMQPTEILASSLSMSSLPEAEPAAATTEAPATEGATASLAAAPTAPAAKGKMVSLAKRFDPASTKQGNPPSAPPAAKATKGKLTIKKPQPKNAPSLTPAPALTPVASTPVTPVPTPTAAAAAATAGQQADTLLASLAPSAAPPGPVPAPMLVSVPTPAAKGKVVKLTSKRTVPQETPAPPTKRPHTEEEAAPAATQAPTEAAATEQAEVSAAAEATQAGDAHSVDETDAGVQ